MGLMMGLHVSDEGRRGGYKLTNKYNPVEPKKSKFNTQFESN